MIRDRALEVGDDEAARAALERPLLWEASELQSAACLAEIYLRTREAVRFRKRQALAFFESLYDSGSDASDGWNPESKSCMMLAGLFMGSIYDNGLLSDERELLLRIWAEYSIGGSLIASSYRVWIAA